MNQLIGEGAISTDEVANKVWVILKEIIRFYCKDLKGIHLNEEEVDVFIDLINGDIKKELIDTKISPCPITFNRTNTIGAKGVYNIDTKQIYLNGDHFLLKKQFTGYMFKEFREIKFDEMYNTIEHELIHQQQDERSKGKYTVDRFYSHFMKTYFKDTKLSDDDVFDMFKKDNKLFNKYLEMYKKFLRKKYGTIIDRKKEIDPESSDKDFIHDVEYYNKPFELNTFAKNAVDMYVKNVLKYLKMSIRNGGRTKRNYSSKEVRDIVLYLILKSKTSMFDDSVRNDFERFHFKNKMISLHRGYKYLTKENKKQWWKYVFQLLFNYKFEPIIVKNEV